MAKLSALRWRISVCASWSPISYKTPSRRAAAENSISLILRLLKTAISMAKPAAKTGRLSSFKPANLRSLLLPAAQHKFMRVVRSLRETQLSRLVLSSCEANSIMLLIVPEVPMQEFQPIWLNLLSIISNSCWAAVIAFVKALALSSPFLKKRLVKLTQPICRLRKILVSKPSPIINSVEPPPISMTKRWPSWWLVWATPW